MLETYHFLLGGESFKVPSTVSYDDLLEGLGIDTIDIVLASVGLRTLAEIEEDAINTRVRSGNQSAHEYIAQYILTACKQLSLSQSQFSINKPEQL